MGFEAKLFLVELGFVAGAAMLVAAPLFWWLVKKGWILRDLEDDD